MAENNKKDIDVFAELMECKYYIQELPPTGVRVESVEKTSLDLRREFEDFCEPTLAEISSYLLSQHTEFIFEAWRLYEREPAEFVQHFDPD